MASQGVIEHGSGKVSRWLRERRLRMAVWIALVEGVLVLVDAIDWWVVVALAVVGVALATIKARPVGNVLVLAGIAVAGIGSGLAGLGIGALAPAIAIAAVLLYLGFVAPASLAKPRPHEHADHH